MEETNNITLVPNETILSIPTPEPAPILLTTVMLLFCFWITVVNALVLVCLLTSKHALRNFVTIQILGFSITDMLVGISAVPLTLTLQITRAFPYFEACAGIFYAYCTSQAANLLHAFAICIHRIVTIKRRSVLNKGQTNLAYVKVLLQIVCIWIVSAVVVAIPFALYGRFGERIRECSFNGLFEEKYINALAFMNITFLTPQVGMTVVYVYMSRYLLTTWRQIKPRGVTKDLSSATATSSFNSRNTKASTLRITATRCNMSSSKFDAGKNKTKYHTASVAIQDAYFEGTNNDEPTHSSMMLNDRHSDMHTHEGNTNSATGKCPENVETSVSRRRGTTVQPKQSLMYSGQRDVLITIGLILLVINIFMTPLNAVILMELVNVELLTRKLKFSLVCLSFMNSALNPFIYSLRIKPFKDAVKDNLKRLKSFCLCE